MDTAEKVKRYIDTTAVVEAALDQPGPTPELKAALNRWLTSHDHKDRLRA